MSRIASFVYNLTVGSVTKLYSLEANARCTSSLTKPSADVFQRERNCFICCGGPSFAFSGVFRLVNKVGCQFGNVNCRTMSISLGTTR